jgi:hypothetical protein
MTYKPFQDDGILLAQPHLITLLDHTDAQFLRRIHYWINHQKNALI